MIDESFNPFDIYNREDVQIQLRHILKRINPSKDFAFKEKAIKIIFSHITGVTNFLGEWFAKLIEISTTVNLTTFQREQIFYLRTHPEDLIRTMRINLVISILLLKSSFSLKDEMGVVSNGAKLIWRAIKHLNFEDLIVETLKEKITRDKSEMWLVLRHPITLLLNAYYLNKNIPLTKVEAVLTELINAGENSENINDLCRQQLEAILGQNVKKYLEINYESLKKYSKLHKNSFPTLHNILENIDDFQKSFVAELNDDEKQEYEFYRNEIENWAKNYPAIKDSVNGVLVIKAIQTITKCHASCINIDNRFLEDLDFNREKKDKLCSFFEKEKNFMIDDVYIEKILTVGELISYWNAFDHNTPLDMMP